MGVGEVRGGLVEDGNDTELVHRINLTQMDLLSCHGGLHRTAAEEAPQQCAMEGVCRHWAVPTE